MLNIDTWEKFRLYFLTIVMSIETAKTKNEDFTGKKGTLIEKIIFSNASLLSLPFP